MKKYLITGGAGFIGSSITKKLLGEGNLVRILDNKSRISKLSVKNASNLEFVDADIRDSSKVELACKNIDSIIHLAYINGTKFFYEKPDLVLDVAVKGIINILDGAKKNKVKELFLASSSEVYQTPPIIPTTEDAPYFIPDPKNPRYSYAGGKIISELMSSHMGRNIFKKVVIFRPHNVYGPGMGTEHVIPELINKILRLKKRSQKITLSIQGDGKQTRSFIYIEDFIEALIILINKGKNLEIYNIGTEDEISIKKLIQILSIISSTKITIKKSVLPEGSTLRRCPNIKKIKTLGFKPKNTLEEGLRKTYLWYSINQSTNQ